MIREAASSRPPRPPWDGGPIVAVPAPSASPQAPLVAGIAPAAALGALSSALQAALVRTGLPSATVELAAWPGPGPRVSPADLRISGPAPVRQGRIQIVAGCRDPDEHPLERPFVIGLDRRVEPAWRLSILVGDPDPEPVWAGLLRLLLDPLFTGRLGDRAAAPSQRPLGRLHREVVVHHVAHGFRDPALAEHGRVLWVDANPAVDTVLSPYGLAILNEIASRRGFLGAIVSPFTDFEQPREGLVGVIERFQPDLIGISLRNIDDALIIRTTGGRRDRIDTTDFLCQVASLVTAVRACYAGPLLLGGAALTRAPQVLMRALGIRFGVQGPGDAIADALFAQWRPLDRSASRPAFAELWRAIPGTLTDPASPDPADGAGPPPRRSRPRALPELAFPVPRDPVRIWRERRLGIAAAVRGTYGCPLECTYCLEATPRLPNQHRDAGAVVDEMQWLLEQHVVRSFHLTDSEANLPFSRMRALAAEIVRRGLQDTVTWTAYCTPRPFEVESIPALCAAGLRGLKLSVDHFAPTQLRSLGKVYPEAAVHHLLSALTRAPRGLRVGVSILFGAPGETLETIEYAVDHMRRYAAHGMEFYYNVGLRLYPGTPLFTDWKEGRLDPALCLGPGRKDGGVSPLVYCAPGSPRLLSLKISKALAHCPSVHLIAASRPKDADESLRRLHVVASRWFRGDVDAAASLLGRMGVLSSGDGTVLRRALHLERCLRRA